MNGPVSNTEVGRALFTGFLGLGMFNHLMGVGTQPHHYYLRFEQWELHYADYVFIG
jgi:hypothetical protein